MLILSARTFPFCIRVGHMIPSKKPSLKASVKMLLLRKNWGKTLGFSSFLSGVPCDRKAENFLINISKLCNASIFSWIKNKRTSE